ncbi:hypothetical protein [Streptomyces luteireticuli]|uniref:hypothetical protein n=1 Tax=Streptomyces luteireticuli TaxID=173858 RepID=UPI0035561D11
MSVRSGQVVNSALAAGLHAACLAAAGLLVVVAAAVPVFVRRPRSAGPDEVAGALVRRS